MGFGVIGFSRVLTFITEFLAIGYGLEIICCSVRRYGVLRL